MGVSCCGWIFPAVGEVSGTRRNLLLLVKSSCYINLNCSYLPCACRNKPANFFQLPWQNGSMIIDNFTNRIRCCSQRRHHSWTPNWPAAASQEPLCLNINMIPWWFSLNKQWTDRWTRFMVLSENGTKRRRGTHFLGYNSVLYGSTRFTVLSKNGPKCRRGTHFLAYNSVLYGSTRFTVLSENGTKRRRGTHFLGYNSVLYGSTHFTVLSENGPKRRRGTRFLGYNSVLYGSTRFTTHHIIMVWPK